MSILAIKGGKPVRTSPFPAYISIGMEEKKAVAEVLDSGVLSKYLGSWSPDFYGGPRVQKLEKEWAEYFRVKWAVSVNSATSALCAAVGASGVGPGDEVIVSPYTMTASVACVLVYNAIPVFADIEPETFCLSAETIRRRLTPRTKALVVVDLFGQPAEMDAIMALAREHKLVVIEDAAQAPGATYHGRYAGTLGHIGVFSLNCHKQINSGEGGVAVTNDDNFAERMQLIRNHAEVVVKHKGTQNIVNLLGFNHRMTEIDAAISSEQLKKLAGLLRPRIEAANYLTERLGKLPGLTPPVVRPAANHAYMVYALRYNAEACGVPRSRVVEALAAEGITAGAGYVALGAGYVEPVYLQPVYQQRLLYGTAGCPFTCPAYRGTVSYERGLCPVTEQMHYSELLTVTICHANITRADLDDFAAGFEKVWEKLEELR
ncbi:MAG: DegT/DnrJ/EryC1/StrS family aminotransferase [Planctomycetota bacterium]